MIAGAAAMTTGPALASVGSQQGSLIFRPATGALTLTPTWSTTDGCPAGYRQSAQMSLFSAHGGFLSRISPAVYSVTTAFTGTLDGTMGQIMHFAKVADGGRIEFAIGCYTQIGGTGQVKWVQSAFVTLSSSGSSYTASSGSSSTQGSASGSSTGPQGSVSGQGQGVAATTTASSSGMSGGAEAGLIAGCSAVVLAIIGFVLYRRRQDRSRLM